MVNLFLYCYERKWLPQTKNRTRLIYFRFLDGLCFFNNDEFENNYDDVYLNGPELKKENEDLYKS